MTGKELQADVVVLGAGPGGYSAAFRAADLGKQVILIEADAHLGGVCLNSGCIPSKTLLHIAQVITEVERLNQHGVHFGKPSFDISQLNDYKQSVITKIRQGLGMLAKQRNVKVIEAAGTFISPYQMKAVANDTQTIINFDYAIIASGSRPRHLPSLPQDDPRIMDSSSALKLQSIPQKLLIVGGGVIGLEMACIYAALGSAVTLIEADGQLLSGCDRDLIAPLEKRLRQRCENIFVQSKLADVAVQEDGVTVQFAGDAPPENDIFDGILLATGRLPNSDGLGLGQVGVVTDASGFIQVDQCQHTNVANIFAIGDVIGPPMLAHKASHQGRVAAEVIAGQSAEFDVVAIPMVVYTNPEIAWVGATETQLKAVGQQYQVGTFPWAASGRALGVDSAAGKSKVLYALDSKRIIGAGITGANAGELIAEVSLAMELAADIEDLAHTVHPHPTLSETVGMAAQVCTGTVTDIYLPPSNAAKR